jgi:hypothetical protein
MVPDSYLYSTNWIVISRAFMAVLLGNARLTTLLNIIFVPAEHMIRLSVHEEDMKQGLIYPGPNTMRRTYLALISGVLIVSLAWLVEVTAWHEASARIEVQTSEHSRTLLSRLLSGLCDAVVSLDQALDILEPAPKMAGLLMRHPTFGDPSAIAGPVNFMDIVHPDDHGPLRTHMDSWSRAADEENNPSVHVRLLDSLGIAVPVMMVCSTLAPMSGKDALCYMIGVNMLAEGPVPETEDAVLPVGQLQHEGPTPRPNSVGSSSLVSIGSWSGGTFSISFRAVTGQVTSASCNNVEALPKHCRNLTTLGSVFQACIWDKPTWVHSFNATMQAIGRGQLSLPFQSHEGPTFFRVGKKKVLMDVTLYFPGFQAEHDLHVDRYCVDVHISCPEEPRAPPSRQALGQRDGPLSAMLDSL